MPLYEFICPEDHREEHFASIADRDKLRLDCRVCGANLKRMPGGKGLLYFEEGRERWIPNLREDRPIRSAKEHKEAMKQRGVVEAGSTIPFKHSGRISEKGRWL
jgi:hypothetical protein